MLYLRNRLSRYRWFIELVIKLKQHRGDFIDQEYWNYIHSADQVTLQPNAPNNIIVGLVKDLDNYNSHIQKRAHWTKYERFLKNNSIRYVYIDIKSANWVNEIKACHLIVFRPDISPASIHEAETKVYFIENHLRIKCFPTFSELWSYEDKIRLYYLFRQDNIPCVPTFITNTKNEALSFLDKTKFPLVSKIAGGSASRGVKLIRSKGHARKLINKVFAEGAATYWPELRQKDYVYFQEYIRDAMFDLRIIIVGNKVFGYYRMKPKNDFRASGAGIYEKKALPTRAMQIALKVKKSFCSTILAVDLIQRSDNKEFLVIEASIFFDVDTPEQSKVDDTPGYYEITYNNNEPSFDFKPGRLWIQELIMKELIETNFENTFYS